MNLIKVKKNSSEHTIEYIYINIDKIQHFTGDEHHVDIHFEERIKITIAENVHDFANSIGDLLTVKKHK